MALKAVEDILSRGKLPIICGGTGFYINSILYKMSYGKTKGDEKIRQKYQEMAKNLGNRAVFEVLKNKDPETAQILHENDLVRVIRALEIVESTGVKKSDIKDEKTPRYDFISIMTDMPRETLYDRINKRVDIMVEKGIESEVKGLIDKGVTIQNQCMQGIGYKEVIEGRETGLSNEEIKELIKKNTRNYAKRQITYFKRMENLTWLSPEDATAENVISLLED